MGAFTDKTYGWVLNDKTWYKVYICISEKRKVAVVALFHGEVFFDLESGWEISRDNIWDIQIPCNIRLRLYTDQGKVDRELLDSLQVLMTKFIVHPSSMSRMHQLELKELLSAWEREERSTLVTKEMPVYITGDCKEVGGG
jgi:hypothetical protein